MIIRLRLHRVLVYAVCERFGLPVYEERTVRTTTRAAVTETSSVETDTTARGLQSRDLVSARIVVLDCNVESHSYVRTFK